MKVLQLGIEESYPEYLKRKIFISNAVTLILCFGVAIPFIFLCMLYFRPLVFIPAFGVLITLSVLPFNYLRLHSLARSIIAILPVVLASTFQAYLSKKGAPIIPSVAMLQLSFYIIPFLVFDIREKALLFSNLAIVATILFSINTLNDALEIDLDTSVIETGWVSKVATTLSLVSSGSCILVLIYQNSSFEKKVESLLRKAEGDTNKIIEQERSLRASLAELEIKQKEDQKRQWASEGVTKCMNLLRNETELNSLNNQFIAFVVKYLGANQGGLFLLDEEQPHDVHLQLMAAYAYNRQKYLKKRVDIGEGLLGQTFLEKQTNHLTQIPEKHLTITSGLGEAPPSALLIVPLKTDETIVGVIEIASFSAFSAFEIEFCENLATNFASTLHGIKTNLKTRELLILAQQQAEKMQAQEEEMRQNMEELQATQEEMHRKEKDYLRQIEMLSQKSNT